MTKKIIHVKEKDWNNMLDFRRIAKNLIYARDQLKKNLELSEKEGWDYHEGYEDGMELIHTYDNLIASHTDFTKKEESS